MVYKPNKLQKIIALLLLCCFALTAFAGCGNNNQQWFKLHGNYNS